MEYEPPYKVTVVCKDKRGRVIWDSTYLANNFAARDLMTECKSGTEFRVTDFIVHNDRCARCETRY